MLCITAKGPGLESDVDPRFGRAAYFLFVDPSGALVEALENHPGGHGAGVNAAQIVAGRNATGVITGAVGPNAMSALEAAGIPVHTVSGGTARAAFEALQAGETDQLRGPTSRGHERSGP